MRLLADCPRVALFLCGCVAFLNLYATQGLLHELAETFDVSARHASWSITVTILAVAVISPFVGWLTACYEQYRVITVAALLLAVPAMLASTASSFGELLIWRVLQGLVIPGVFITTVAYIGVRWSGAAVTEMTGLYVAGTVLGGFGGRFVAGLVTAYSDWRMALVLLGCLTLATGLLIAILLPRHPWSAGKPLADRQALRAELLSRPLLGAYCVGFCVLFAQVATFTYVGLHLSQAPFNLGTAGLSSIYAVFLLALVVVPVASRLGNARPQAERLQVAGCLGIAGSALTLSSSLWVIVLGLALSATGVFLAQAAANAFITVHAQQHKAAAVGLYLTCYYLGGSFGASLPGLLWDPWGWAGCIALIVLLQVLPMLIARVSWGSPQSPEAHRQLR